MLSDRVLGFIYYVAQSPRPLSRIPKEKGDDLDKSSTEEELRTNQLEKNITGTASARRKNCRRDHYLD